MVSLVNRMVDTYNYIFTDLADPRVNHFFLLPSPLPILTVTALYLYFCTSFGPRYMKNRPAYNLKHAVLLYNVFQVCISSYIFYEGIVYMTSGEYSFSCDPIDYSDSPRAQRAINAAWWYFMNKVIEFLDTIFFVLRKKNNQISFLHVYHHSMMAIMMWYGAKYYNGGHGLLMGIANSFVHIVMYTYYLMAGLGPEYQKYLWWKKHVTTLQLIQFVLILVHNLIGLFNSECSYPKHLHVGFIMNSALFINLFGRFFIASYLKPKAKTGAVKNGTATNGTATNGSATNGTAANGTAACGTGANGTATNGTLTKGLAKNESITEEIMKNCTHINGSSTNGLVKNGTATNGVHKNGSTKVHENGMEKNGLHSNSKYKNE